MGRRELLTLAKILVLPLSLFFLMVHLSCGKQEGNQQKPTANSPPVILSALIFPEKPSKGTELGVNVQSQDPENDPITYTFQWFRNDEEMIGENGSILKGETLRKGDLVRFQVTPSDGKLKGTPFQSPPVRILNSLPVIQEVRIEPRLAYASDSLRTVVAGSDGDGDFVYYTYQWEKNGALLPDERGEILKPGRFKKGDSITVTVTPDDREIRGQPKQSDPLVVSNSPPLIVSSPPTSVEGVIYRYSVKVNDPDNDPITFHLKSGPRGMGIDKNTGLIRWEIRKEDRGAHPIEIEAADSDGAKSLQRYTLTVEFKEASTR